MRLVVVEGSRTIVDHTATLHRTHGSGEVTVAGYLQDARDRLDFDIDVLGRKSGGVERADVVFELGIAGREFLVAGDIAVEKEAGVESGSMDLRVRHGASSFDSMRFGSPLRAATLALFASLTRCVAGCRSWMHRSADARSVWTMPRALATMSAP